MSPASSTSSPSSAPSPPLPLYHNVLHNPNYLLGGASDTGVLWGAVGEVICALAGIGTAVALYPVAKRHSQTGALGFVTSRIIEAAMIMVGVLSVLSLVTLHKAGASGADAASMVTTGRSLVALHDWTFLFGPGRHARHQRPVHRHRDVPHTASSRGSSRRSA